VSVPNNYGGVLRADGIGNLYYVQSNTAQLVKLVGATGATAWTAMTPCNADVTVTLDAYSVAPSTDNKYVYVVADVTARGATVNTAVCAVSIDKGAYAWRTLLPPSTNGLGVQFFSDGTVLVTTNGDTVTVFDPAKGFVQRGSMTAPDRVYSLALGSNNMLFATTRRGFLFGVDASARAAVAVRFTVRVSAGLTAITTTANNVVVAQGADGATYGFSSGGNKLWSFRPTSGLPAASGTGGFAVGPGFVAIPANDGFVYAVRTASSSSHKMSGGAIAGTVIAVLLGVAFCVGVAWWMRSRQAGGGDSSSGGFGGFGGGGDAGGTSGPYMPMGGAAAPTALQSAMYPSTTPYAPPPSGYPQAGATSALAGQQQYGGPAYYAAPPQQQQQPPQPYTVSAR
jgi:hypothetical protein